MDLSEILKESLTLDINDRLVLASKLSASVLKETQGRRPILNSAADSALRNFDTMRTAIGVCVGSGCPIPALMLIYAGIDIAGALNASTVEYQASGAKFRDWVARYMLSRLGNQVTAQELWLARCGLLHVYSSSSNPATPTEISREISYVAYTPEKEQFINSLRHMTVSGHRPDLNGYVVLSVQEIAVAYDEGWVTMLSEVLNDPARRPLFEQHSVDQFANVSMPENQAGP